MVKERHFYEFFLNVKAFLRKCDIETTEQKWNERDYELNDKLLRTQSLVHDRLADNFDTPETVNLLSDLTTEVNKYISQDSRLIKVPLVRKATKYVAHILKVFGVYTEDLFPQLT